MAMSQRHSLVTKKSKNENILHRTQKPMNLMYRRVTGDFQCTPDNFFARPNKVFRPTILHEIDQIVIRELRFVLYPVKPLLKGENKEKL